MLRRLKNWFFPYNPLSGIIANKEYFDLIGAERLKFGQINLFGSKISFSDNLGFVHSLEEIFIEQVYKFDSADNFPFIIDAGSNIGLSIIYFKQLYPYSKILAFEPDPEIYKLLYNNVLSFGLSDVELKNAAVWIEDKELKFYPEGSLAGPTEIDIASKNMPCLVKAERIKKFITNRKVDFLKIDIEGAENILLFDIVDELKNVEHLFLEYHSIAGKEQKLGEILQIIKGAGFKYHIRTAYNNKIFPFIDKIEKGFDMQLNIFCFRK